MHFYLRLRLATAGAMLMATFAAPPAIAEKTGVYHFGVWTLRTHFDSFYGQTACRLRTDYVEFDGHLLRFHINSSPSTVTAEVRVNSGPVLYAVNGRQKLRIFGAESV